VRRVPALVLALAVLLAAGCGKAKKDELSGPFGPGVGGPADGTATPLALTKLDGSVLGAMDYWLPNFDVIPNPTPGELPLGFQESSNGILMGLELIVGRIDTPCRYGAALLARDEGFNIQASGHRSNDQGLEFYQVNVSRGGEAVSFYCTSLRDSVGIMITGHATAPDRLTYREVHFILNSIRP
jgi:hypothetical protein